jgi:hypothetical protein
VDSTGVVLQYVYDPVGNLLQINRSTVSPGVLTIFNVTPLTIGAGGTLTIQGQGFSANLATDGSDRRRGCFRDLGDRDDAIRVGTGQRRVRNDLGPVWWPRARQPAAERQLSKSAMLDGEDERVRLQKAQARRHGRVSQQCAHG